LFDVEGKLKVSIDKGPTHSWSRCVAWNATL